MSPVRALRSLVNIVGLAWWAKIDTGEPSASYWFGPFLTRRSLKLKLSIFLDELEEEGSKYISHSFIRCRRSEPLTT